MDKKTPPKFNPLYHPAPALNPRPPGMAAPGGMPQGSGPHPHPHMAIPSSSASAHKPSALPTTTQFSAFGPTSSAFEMLYNAPLPDLTHPAHPEPRPKTPSPPPVLPPIQTSMFRSTPPLSRSISTVSGPLRFRRERMMIRHHTLQSETSFDKDKIDTPQDTVPPSPTSLLAPPDVRQTKCVQLELPPHRRDTLDKIPRRARSQSWLVRTRHLLDDDKSLTRTPWIAHCLYALSVFMLVITFPFCLPFCVKVAREYERVVVFRTGRLIKGGTKGPGMFFILPCIDTYRVVDLRVLSFDVPAQEILSRDSVTVSVEAVVYFRISNPIISVTNVNDAQFSTKLLAQTTLRNVLGTKTLSEILQERDNISSVTEKILDEGTDPWGVKVQRVEIKDIRLPQMLTRAMAAEAEASRDARARVIAADGERNASHNLVEAANTISENRAALHLRFLQTISHIAAEHNHTIVVPVSMEIMRALKKKLASFWEKENTGTKEKV